MAYRQQGLPPPAMGATFVPGGYDDFYMPNPGPELVSPAPQRLVCFPSHAQPGILALHLVYGLVASVLTDIS